VRLRWESPIATNIETMLEMESAKRLGSVVDVRYDPVDPSRALVGPIPSVIGWKAVVYLVAVFGWYTSLTNFVAFFINPPPGASRI
jgi:hypothetical protein